LNDDWRNKVAELTDNIKGSFENVIQVYKAVADLLQEADELMREEKYECIHGSSIRTEQSKRVTHPLLWIPSYVSRFYRLGKREERRGIGIQFVNLATEKPISPILLSGSFWESKRGEPELPPSSLWDAWMLLGDEKEHGKSLVFKGLGGIFDGRIRAINLEVVQNRDDLQKLVVEPLVAMERP